MLRAPIGERRVSQPQAIRRLQRTQGAAHLSFGISGVQRWREDGAAKVRLPRRPKDAPAEAILINTAGGLTGGDSLDWRFDVAATSLVATTQAAEKIYRSLGDDAEIHSRLTGSSGAQLYWLPQEAILFDGARLRRSLDVDLTGGATLLALEATVFGRRAMGESIQDLAFHDRWRVRREGGLIFADDIRFDGALPRTVATLGEAGAMATLLLVAEDAEIAPRRTTPVSRQPTAPSAPGMASFLHVSWRMDGFDVAKAAESGAEDGLCLTAHCPRFGHSEEKPCT